MLEHYEHPVLGLDLVKLESDLKMIHESEWVKDKNLLANIENLYGPEFVKEIVQRMTAHRNLLKTLVQAMDESPIVLPELPA
jgi:hypothetical protein